jgi:hypothetical protein
VTQEGKRDTSVEAKKKKAARYAREPSRFVISSLSAVIDADHGTRNIVFSDGVWSCTCDFFHDNKTCSHVMAAQLILTDQARVRVAE